MYIRPQLKRKPTGSKEILSGEHADEVKLSEKVLAEGERYVRDGQKVEDMIREISGDDRLSDTEKESVLKELEEMLSEDIPKEYEKDTEATLSDIAYSMEERTREMEDAVQERWDHASQLERMVWETDAVRDDKLVKEGWDMYKEYENMLNDSKEELNDLMEKAEAQKQKIKTRR